jgi:hypothetical protein
MNHVLTQFVVTAFKIYFLVMYFNIIPTPKLMSVLLLYVSLSMRFQNKTVSEAPCCAIFQVRRFLLVQHMRQVNQFFYNFNYKSNDLRRYFVPYEGDKIVNY